MLMEVLSYSFRRQIRWLTLNSAFGLFARALPPGEEFAVLREACEGIELADSITGDAHKCLNVVCKNAPFPTPFHPKFSLNRPPFLQQPLNTTSTPPNKQPTNPFPALRLRLLPYPLPPSLNLRLPQP